MKRMRWMAWAALGAVALAGFTPIVGEPPAYVPPAPGEDLAPPKVKPAATPAADDILPPPRKASALPNRKPGAAGEPAPAELPPPGDLTPAGAPPAITPPGTLSIKETGKDSTKE
ncbi:MAG TPA: hypothetical protein VNC50_08515, partial [Planctomycetia bacterium]|nr:hypothetical protein [Planctomycetia bacterium]